MSAAAASRVALVTGAAGDIGRAVASRLVADGWWLALTDHPLAGDRLVGVAGEIDGSGGRVWSATCDVVDADAVRSLIDRCCVEIGTPTGLFNNAGVQGAFAPVSRTDLVDARRVLDVNVIGTITVLEEVARTMVRSSLGGAVVNMASMAGVSGAPNMPAYSASKAAVIGLTKAAAKDLAPSGIRVNAISPAFIGPGAMWDAQVAAQAAVGSQYYDRSPEVVARQMIDMVPMRRFGSTAEVASVVSFLMSDDASYVTGQNIEITGGAM